MFSQSFFSGLQRIVFSIVLIGVVFPAALCGSRSFQARADEFVLPDTDDGLPGAGPLRRYDWFRNLWQERRSLWAKRQADDQQAVVFLGDSITQGWGDDFQGLFPGMKAANRGISGDTTRGMLIRLQDDVIALKPRAVVMLMGTNDLEEKAQPEVIAGNLRLMIDQLHEQCPETPIVLCLVFPSSASKNRPAESIQAINRLYARAVRGDALVTVVDTWTLFANEMGDAKPEEMPDLLHLNDVGYKKWAAAVRPILATLGLLETEADNFQNEEGFESLFNGSDLTGWGYRITPEATRVSARRWMSKDPEGVAWPFVDEPVSFDGKAMTPDSRYRAVHGRLVVATPPEGRCIQQLYTTKEFAGDFTLKLEFRATPNADSGVFIREPQLQCRDYALAGPYKSLKNYRAGDWNELIVQVRDGTARCTCNGEVIEEALKVPKNGPVGLEGDRGQMEYRRIRIRMD